MVKGGAERVTIATNTVHKVAEQVMERIGERHFLHIGDCITAHCYNQRVQRVLLLGTKETMSGNFIRGRLENGGLDVIVPDLIIQKELDRIIFRELCRDSVRPGTVKWFHAMLSKMLREYAVDGVILGCTELVMLSAKLKEQDLFQLQQCNRCCRQPVIFIDSAEAQIAAITQVCLGKWCQPSPEQLLRAPS